MPDWVQHGVGEYQKRLPKQWQFKLNEINQAGLNSAALNRSKESSAILGSIPSKAHIVALDNRGQSWSTEKLAAQLQLWQELGKPVSLLIGGPDGLDQNCIERANQLWSLSPLTFPHPLVRVIVVEQLYRAHSLLNNHPYHRA